MKEKAFINAKNLPRLRDAFSKAVGSVADKDNDYALDVSVIGEPGVGKSFITTKLSQGVLGIHMHSISQAVPREEMADLILWSDHTNGKEQIIQYDEASLRFVDEDYHSLVQKERVKSPLPTRHLPGVNFIEHPDQETENASDLIVRMKFSDKQQEAINAINHKIQNSSDHIMIHKKALRNIASLGCEIEIETTSDRIDDTPLVEFFEEYGNHSPPSSSEHDL